MGLKFPIKSTDKMNNFKPKNLISTHQKCPQWFIIARNWTFRLIPISKNHIVNIFFIDGAPFVTCDIEIDSDPNECTAF